MSNNSHLAVLILAHGTPRNMDEVDQYYQRIHPGSAPGSTYVKQLRNKFSAIGGHSPLCDITTSQARLLEKELQASGLRAQVFAAFRYANPGIDAVVQEIASRDFDQVAAVVMTPQYSRLANGAYRREVQEAFAAAGRTPHVTWINSWYEDPAVIAAYASRLRASVREAVRQAGKDYHVMTVFTVHSLPVRSLVKDDRFLQEAQHTCQLVGTASGIQWYVLTYQSRGRLGGPWLEPAPADVLPALAEYHVNHIVLAPVGFACDHLEILYDLDVELQQQASDLGITYHRMAMPNDDPDFIQALGGVVRARLTRYPSAGTPEQPVAGSR